MVSNRQCKFFFTFLGADFRLDVSGLGHFVFVLNLNVT